MGKRISRMYLRLAEKERILNGPHGGMVSRGCTGSVNTKWPAQEACLFWGFSLRGKGVVDEV